MRYLILTDMHGNADALETVLRRVRRKRFDAILVLGDLVGYGGSPNQVVQAIRGLPNKVYVVRGNHDKVAAAIEDGSSFNRAALAAARWTNHRLTRGNLRYLRQLPQGPIEVEEGLAICHGSPLHEDTYVFSEFDAWEVFRRFPTKLTFFGHTHLPSVFVLHANGVRGVLLAGNHGKIRVQPGLRYLINPGSVGQPRDRNPRASYMVYDSRRQIITWRRLDYPIARAQERIRRAGLPRSLADRLSQGI